MTKTSPSPAQLDELELRLTRAEDAVRGLHQELQLFKKNPGTWHVMRYYLKGQGYKLTDIDNILAGVEEFLRHFLPK